MESPALGKSSFRFKNTTRPLTWPKHVYIDRYKNIFCYLSILFTDTTSNASKRRIRHKRTAATIPMLAAVKAVAEQPKGDPCHRCLQHGGLKPKWGLQFCVRCLGDIRCKHVGLRTHGGGADAVKENKLQMTTDACVWRKDMEGYGSSCTHVQKADAHARTKEQASKHMKQTYEEDAEFVIDDDLVYTEDNYVIHCKTWHPDWSEERSRHDFELKLDGQTDKYFTKGAKRFPRIRIPDPQARIRKQTGVVHKRGVVETNEIPSEWAQAKSRRLLAKLRDGVQGEDADGGSDSDDDPLDELATGAASSKSLDGDSEVAPPTAAYSERCAKPTSESSKSAGRKRTAESVTPSMATSTEKFLAVCAGGSDGGAGDGDKKDEEKGGACGTIRQNVTMMNSVEFLQMKGELQARTLAELKRVQGKNGMKVMLAAVSETCKK